MWRGRGGGVGGVGGVGGGYRGGTGVGGPGFSMNQSFPDVPTAPPAAKRPRQTASTLIPEMFVDPWIQEYARVEDAGLRRALTKHLSSASRESVELRAGRAAREKELERNKAAAEAEVEIFF